MTNTDDQPGTSSTRSRPTPGQAMQVSSPDHERLPMYSGGDGLERLLTAIDSYVQLHTIPDAEAATILINKLEGEPYNVIAMLRRLSGEDPSYANLKARLRSPNLTDVKPRLNPFAPDGLLSLRHEPNETPAHLFLRVSTHCLPDEEAKIMGAADNVAPNGLGSKRQKLQTALQTAQGPYLRYRMSSTLASHTQHGRFHEVQPRNPPGTLPIRCPRQSSTRHRCRQPFQLQATIKETAATTTTATTTPATTTAAITVTTTVATPTTTMVITTTAKVAAPNATAPGAPISVSGQRRCTAPDVNNGASTHATTAATPAVR